MSLQQQLDECKTRFNTQISEKRTIKTIDIEAAIARSIRELAETGQAAQAIKVGDVAPDFALQDSEGNDVVLKQLLLNGPVVLTFYRGFWCPYCNIELKSLEKAAADIRKRNATLVAISMQSAPYSQKSKKEHKLSFPIVIDQGGKITEKFGLLWTLQPYVIEFHKIFNVELPTIHNDDAWNLPMPARYIINTNGLVVYSEINPDYTKRPDPNEMFPVLDKLTA